MKKSECFDFEIDAISFGYAKDRKDGDLDYFEIDVTDNDSLTNAAKDLNCSIQLIEAVASSFETLKDALKDDLISLWKKIED